MSMINREERNDQTALWNGTAGQAWVAMQSTLDRALRPFEDLLAEAVHAVYPGKKSAHDKPAAVVATVVLRELEAE